MKKYWKQIVGALILVLVLILINKATQDKQLMGDNDRNKEVIVNPNAISGEVVAIFEGEHKLNYELVLAEGATTSLSKNNRLLTVKSASGTDPIYFYFSYEGGRGYTPVDYINNVIQPSTVIVKQENMTHGGNNWSVVRSTNSSWHVGQFGEWLVVIENANVNKDLATKYIDSFRVANNDGNNVNAEMNHEDMSNTTTESGKGGDAAADKMKMISTSSYEMN